MMIKEKLHLKRSAIDNALALLKECNLIQEKKQGKNLPNIIYIGKTIGTIENEKVINFMDAQKQHSGVHETSSPKCSKPTIHNNYNNKYINNNNMRGSKNSFQNYEQRHYDNLDYLYTNKC